MGTAMRYVPIFLALTFALGGCATVRNALLGAHQQEFCYSARPIYPRPADVLTAETMREIAAHDNQGETLCGWVPPAKEKK